LPLFIPRYQFVSSTLIPEFFKGETYNGKVLWGKSQEFGEYSEFFNMVGGIAQQENTYTHPYKCFNHFDYNTCYDHIAPTEIGGNVYLGKLWRLGRSSGDCTFVCFIILN
jgi:hypothetical protein